MIVAVAEDGKSREMMALHLDALPMDGVLHRAPERPIKPLESLAKSPLHRNPSWCSFAVVHKERPQTCGPSLNGLVR